jgi:paraquat-inducible protein A
MIDVFMLTILVALVRMGFIATVLPGLGAIAFASVVVLTMFSAHSFDPRLMWDAAEAAGHDVEAHNAHAVGAS